MVKRLLARGYAHNEPIAAKEGTLLGGWLVFRALFATDILTWAAALAYTFVFSLIPLVATTLAFFTAFPTLQNQRAHLLDFLSQQLLPGAVQGVREYLDRFSSRAATAGTISSITFLLTTLLLFQSIEAAFNRIWRVKHGRSWSRRFSALAVFFVIGMVGATLLLVLSNLFGQAPPTELLQMGSLFVAWAIFVVLNKVLPNTSVRWRSAAIGGVVAGTVWHFLKAAFTWYIQTFASYTSVYGALAAVPIFFLWVYLTFVLIMLATYIAFVTQNLRALILEQQGQSKGRTSAFFRVAVATVLGRAFLSGRGPLAPTDVSRRLNISRYFVDHALDELCEAGIIASLGDERAPRFILIRPIENLPLGDLIFSAGNTTLAFPRLPQGARPSSLYRSLERIFAEIEGGRTVDLTRVTLKGLIDSTTATTHLSAA